MPLGKLISTNGCGPWRKGSFVARHRRCINQKALGLPMGAQKSLGNLAPTCRSCLHALLRFQLCSLLPTRGEGWGGGSEGVKLARPPSLSVPPVQSAQSVHQEIFFQRAASVQESGPLLRKVLHLPSTHDRLSGVASEMGDVDRSTVNLRAVNTKVPQILQPILIEILKSQPKKIFSGNPSEFPAWKKKLGLLR